MSSTCTSCGRNVGGASKAVKFSCPGCGEEIVRCGRCKKMSREYQCPECGTKGP